MLLIDQSALLEEIETLKNKYGSDRSALIPILEDLQEHYRYLPGVLLQETAHALDIHPVEVEGVATFYSFFKTDKPLGKYVIRLCQTISCDLAGKARIARQLENELGIVFGETTRDGLFTLEYTNCLGMCDQGPAIMINDRLIANVVPSMVPEIVEECKRDFRQSSFPRMTPNVIRKSGPMVDHGVTRGEALKRAMENTPEQIIEMLTQSGLKGRGGAGFPTGLKWKFAKEAEGDERYVVCNADEGEPGTFKDRFLLDEHIEQMIDGMTIAAHTIGSRKGYIYLRGEYLYLKEHIDTILESRYDEGMLGKSILGRDGFDFDLILRMGAGAYICGEETALIESLEGKRGEPRNRPPFPVTIGLFGKPTVVNNVETFVDAALILAKGVEWFKQHGTEKSTGMKLFSISGDCEKPGIYELPFGITVSDLLKESGGEDAKAVQIGGASGKTVARKDFERTLAFEDIPSGGSIIVFGPDRDMLEIGINFMEFFVEESCGQCTPCRIGNVKLLAGLKLLKEGKCSISYLNELLRLAESVQLSSRCGLGQTSPNSFIDIITEFKEEILGRLPEKESSNGHKSGETGEIR